MNQKMTTTITESGASWIAGIFDRSMTQANIRSFEVFIIRLAVLFFLGHLAVIFFLNHSPELYGGEPLNYLKAIYTPFSFILAYEVFLLIIILPESTTEFIGKQFEIITLITLRSFFHDIADIRLHAPFSLSDPAVAYLGYDLIASLIMFSLTIVFHRLHSRHREHDVREPLTRFINLKKSVSLCLLVVLAVTSGINLVTWINHAIPAFIQHAPFPDPNVFFYLDFFNVMIFADVLLLILSFFYDSSFYSVMRNASFIISTILLRLSLSMERPANHMVVIVAFVFAVAVIALLQFRPKASHALTPNGEGGGH